MKRFLKWFLMLICLLAAGASLLFWSLIQVPEDYRQRVTIAPEVRTEKLAELKVKTDQLVQEIKSKPVWTFELTEVEANSWLTSSQYEQEIEPLLPEEVSDPRVKFTDDVVQLSFQVSHQEWSGVVTIRVKVIHLSSTQMTVQIESLTAGVLPVSLKDLFTEMVDQDQLPLNVDWQQTEQGDQLTLLLPEGTRLQGEVESIQVKTGTLTVIGSQSESAELPGG